MLRRAALLVAILAVVGAALGWFLTAPQPLEAAELPQHTPDPVSGERVFHASGCRHCHNAPGSTDPNDLFARRRRRVAHPIRHVSGAQHFADPQSGIGGWTTLQFVNAVTRGVSPDGAHYYPAFPYSSFTRMRLEDVIDLKAYMDTLPAVTSEVAGHDLSFPFNIAAVWAYGSGSMSTRSPSSSSPTQTTCFAAANIWSKGRVTAASATPRATSWAA
jgi:hypothetical protein